MTTADVTAQLPNGFHDAVLRELHVDFAGQEVRLEFEFWVGDLDAETEEGREAMRGGTLRLTGVTAMRIDPPDPATTSRWMTASTWTGGFGV
jgi:hypothetical protein